MSDQPGIGFTRAVIVNPDTDDSALTDDWRAGFRRGFDVGCEAGLAVGYSQGWDAHGEMVDAWLGVTRAALKAPTRDELAERRQYRDDQCPTRCDRCSRCVRAAAVLRNRARHGQDDYPGAEPT
jgi:hypothetical protein